MRIKSLRFTVARQSYISPVRFASAVNMFHVNIEFFSFQGVKAAVEQYQISSYCQYYVQDSRTIAATMIFIQTGRFWKYFTKTKQGRIHGGFTGFCNSVKIVLHKIGLLF